MSAELRVFHLIKSLGRGGAETLLAESLRFADRERFAYEFGYFLPWKTAMVPSLEAHGAEVTCFGARHNAAILLAARRVAAHLRRARVDVLHCHLPVAGAVGRVAGRMAGVPVVYTEHNMLERYHPLTRRLNLASWGWQAQALAVSADVAESIGRHAAPRVPVRVVRNGVDTARFRREDADARPVRRQLGIPDGAPVVGTVAVFRVQKRLEDWLAAARLVRDRHPGAHFVLVGDGPLREDVVAGIRACGLEGAVHLPGLQEDVRPYLAAMDVYLMSSVFEGLPVALLEAMSMRCAVVATAVGGIPEAVEHGRDGVLVEARRPERLAAATADLLADPAALAAYGAAARRTVETRFSMARMVAELESVYTGVARERVGAR